MASQVFPCIFLFYFHFYTIYAHASKSIDKTSIPLEFLGQNLKDVLNDSSEFAPEKYRDLYNINIIRRLDSNTTAETRDMRYRSSLPDFFNPSKNTIQFHTPSHYSFFSGRPKWNKRGLKYAFNKNVKESTKLPLENALKPWVSSTPFKFFRVDNLSQADIQISFMRGYHGDGHPFGGPDAGLAHTFAPPDGRVHFDAGQNWSSNGEENAYDIQSVEMHELGHTLGLGHSRDKKAIMYSVIYPGERKGLHEDDINGIKALYNIK